MDMAVFKALLAVDVGALRSAVDDRLGLNEHVERV
jgi:hypothetical protein